MTIINPSIVPSVVCMSVCLLVRTCNYVRCACFCVCLCLCQSYWHLGRLKHSTPFPIQYHLFFLCFKFQIHFMPFIVCMDLILTLVYRNERTHTKKKVKLKTNLFPLFVSIIKCINCSSPFHRITREETYQ